MTMDTMPTAESNSVGSAGAMSKGERNAAALYGTKKGVTFDRMPYLRRFNALKFEAQTWWPAWRDIQKYLAPTKGFFEGDVPNHGKTIDHKTLLDGHATRSLNILGSGMTSGLTSPSRPWFKLTITDKDLAEMDAVKEWLSVVQERMLAVFSRSNIYGILNSCYQEIGAFGTAAIVLLEDYKTVIRGRNFTAGEYFLSTGPDGRIDTFARQFKMTSGQLIKEFGKENVGQQVRMTWERNEADVWFDVIHLLEPNDDRVQDRADFRGKAYRSLYWQPISMPNEYLRISGFDDFPVLAPRWDTTTTADVYGRGPGWHALGDIKMLQKMQKSKLMALDKLVDPPVQADSNIAEDINLMPGGVNRSSSMSQNAGVRAVYQVQPDIAHIDQSIVMTKQAIDSFFFADLFMMIAQTERPDMTAREIVERHEEKLLMLGPVLERLESELLDPLIDRTFNIMLRAGLIPPPPKELQGSELHVEYISMLAQAQKMVGTTAIEQVARFTGGLLAAAPDVLDNFDSDEAVREYAGMLGTPPKIIRSPEIVAQIRAAREKQKAQAAAAAAAGATVNAAKVLSDTKVGQTTALDQILNNQPPGVPAQ